MHTRPEKTNLNRYHSLLFPRRAGFLPGQLEIASHVNLKQIERHIQKKRWKHALVLLEALDQQYPQQPDVLEYLLEVHFQMGNSERYQEAAERLLKIQPHNADLAYSLAGVCLINHRPAMALQALKSFVIQWPSHDLAAEAYRMMQEIEQNLPRITPFKDLPEDQVLEATLQNEKIQAYYQQGRYYPACILAQKLLKKHPHLTLVWGYLSQIYWAEGKLGKALLTAQQAVELEPYSLAGLSNLAKLYYVTRQEEAARAILERFASIQERPPLYWTSLSETLSFSGDDEAVLALLKETEGLKRGTAQDAMFYLYAATAAAQLADEREARRLLRKAERIEQGVALIEANLADQSLPPERRNALWSFSLEDYVPRVWVKELNSIISKPGIDRDLASSAIEKFLDKHPTLPQMAAHAMQRGGPDTRQFFLTLAKHSRSRELLQAALAFAQGSKGSDEMRLQAAQIALEAGLLPAGVCPLWVGGQWRDMLLLNLEIHSDSLYPHSKEVEILAQKAHTALAQKEWKIAKAYLNQALEIEPDSPDLLNNLSYALELEGKIEDSHHTIREVQRIFPDYVISQVGLARFAIYEGRLAEAHEILDLLLRRERMHNIEFDVFCACYIRLLIAEDRFEAAKTWLEMWHSVNPDSAQVEEYREFFRAGDPARKARLKGD